MVLRNPPDSPSFDGSDPTAYLPPLPSLQAWVHRPQAVAKCFITDIVGLRALVHQDGDVSHTTRDVFLLDHFPCKNVEVVAWVAGVVHKESTVTITLDEGNGVTVLEVVVRLAQIEIPRPKVKSKPVMRSSTFRSRMERRNDPSSSTGSGLPAADNQLYMRPDIRVGDTVRVVGRVDEWSRGKKEWVRQLSVDMASGLGSITVVDPEEAYDHIETVCRLHQTLYSRPFVMVSSTPTPGPSPSKSVLSCASDTYDFEDEEEDSGPDLPDPSKLSASRLTEATYKRYVLDHMTRETIKTMRDIRGKRIFESHVPTLAVLFPEYKASSRSAPRRRDVNLLGISQMDNTCQVDGSADLTPRATFRSRPERESSTVPACEAKTPVSRHFRTRAERELDKPSDSSTSLPVFTVPALLQEAKLRDLAARIVDARARHEEKQRRRRAKLGIPTARDLQLVADRLSRGLDEGAYKLSTTAREVKMIGLTEWAIRQAHQEGGVVHAEISAGESSWRRSSTVGYLPLPPELLAPLLVPIVSGQRGTFRSKLERARDLEHGVAQKSSNDATTVTARLRAWGEEGRWERVGQWAVEAALEWGRAQGILDS